MKQSNLKYWPEVMMMSFIFHIQQNINATRWTYYIEKLDDGKYDYLTLGSTEFIVRFAQHARGFFLRRRWSTGIT